MGYEIKGGKVCRLVEINHQAVLTAIDERIQMLQLKKSELQAAIALLPK